MDVGVEHSCAIRTNQTVTCWDDNSFGQPNASDGTYTAVFAGTIIDAMYGEYYSFSCGLRTSGVVACWGSVVYDGQLSSPDDAYSSIADGSYNTCARRLDLTITCWGSNEYGQSVAPDGIFLDIAASRAQTCALRTDRTISCWMTAALDGPWVPDEIALIPGGTYLAISAGYVHTCGLRTDQAIACWGTHGYSNEYRQLDVPDGTYTAVAAAGGHSCGLRTDQTNFLLG